MFFGSDVARVAKFKIPQLYIWQGRGPGDPGPVPRSWDLARDPGPGTQDPVGRTSRSDLIPFAIKVLNWGIFTVYDQNYIDNTKTYVKAYEHMYIYMFCIYIYIYICFVMHIPYTYFSNMFYIYV